MTMQSQPEWFKEYDEKNSKEHAALMAVQEAHGNQVATVLTKQDEILEELQEIKAKLP